MDLHVHIMLFDFNHNFRILFSKKKNTVIGEKFIKVMELQLSSTSSNA